MPPSPPKMAASLSRRLLLTSKLLLQNQNPNPKPYLQSHRLLQPLPFPNLKPFIIPHFHPFSSTSPQNPNPEIEGPTVDRDTSALADETRRSLHSLRKSIYDLSSSLALLSFAHLGLGACIAYTAEPADEVSIQSLAAFAFPFSVAFLMRRSLKPLSFFQKMEEQGRLQVLTLSLQAAKNLSVLFVRVRVVAFCCVIGISAGSVVAILWR